MSSQTVITVRNSNTQECHSSFTYEAAMEALSSLITRKKRDRILNNTDTKYTKLERMSMYIQVTSFSIYLITFNQKHIRHHLKFEFQILGIKEQIADLNIIHVAGTKGKVLLFIYMNIFWTKFYVVILFDKVYILGINMHVL